MTQPTLAERLEADRNAASLIRSMAEYGELSLKGRTEEQREAARKEWKRLDGLLLKAQRVLHAAHVLGVQS